MALPAPATISPAKAGVGAAAMLESRRELPERVSVPEGAAGARERRALRAALNVSCASRTLGESNRTALHKLHALFCSRKPVR